MKRMGSLLLALVMAAALCLPAAAEEFTDVPPESALADEVQKAVAYGLMNGYTQTHFGYGDSMTRAQFVAVLTRMMQWAQVEPVKASFLDVPVNHKWYKEIETALANDVLDSGTDFRPADPVTRGEMAEMLVRALGLKSAAAMAEQENSLPFNDVTQRKGYVTVAYAIGMTKGTGAETFSPDANATRAQAAAMLVRIYEKLQTETDFYHGFYAFDSYGQLDYAKGMNTVSAAWSRIVWDGEEALLSTGSEDGNDCYIPAGYQSVTSYMRSRGVGLHLNVLLENAGVLLADESGRVQALEQIISELQVEYEAIGRNPYSGVTLDFTGLKAESREHFNAFLEQLAQEVHAMEKTLYVCVSPVLTDGAYDDGYDYRTIGALADKVILKLHGYSAADLSAYAGSEACKTAAPVPMDQVFLSLMAMVHEETGVEDHTKIVLDYSTECIAWQVDETGKLASGQPLYPDTKVVYQYLMDKETVKGWSQEDQMPYAIYKTEDGARYFLWYDVAKPRLNAAKLLGITGVSVRNLGSIPMSIVWNWAFILPN